MEIETWLRSLGLDEHAGAFAENDVDGDTAFFEGREPVFKGL